MFTDYLTSFGTAVPMGIVSLLTSMGLFAYILWRAFRMPAATVRTLEHMPLDTMEPATGRSHEVTR